MNIKSLLEIVGNDINLVIDGKAVTVLIKW